MGSRNHKAVSWKKSEWEGREGVGDERKLKILEDTKISIEKTVRECEKNMKTQNRGKTVPKNL